MSGRSLQKVYKVVGPHHLCWVGRCHKHASKLLTTPSATVGHGCARSLLKPCATNSNRSIHVFLSQTFVASRSRSTLSVGSHAALRVVPTVLTLQGLLACSSRHRHHCRIPILKRFHHFRYFAVCNAFVNPSALFVCVGSLISVNFLSSCFA